MFQPFWIKEKKNTSIIYADLDGALKKFTVPTSKLQSLPGGLPYLLLSIGGWREHNNGTKNGSCKNTGH